MRNFKRFLSLMLAALMVLGACVFTAGAADTADYSDAAASLAAIGVLKGDENGNLMLDKSVTRYQAALFFVQAITGKTDPSVWNADKSAIFTDVPEYGTAIDYLYGLGLVIGRGDGSYGYNDPLTYQDMLTIAVRVLGYETEDMQYPYGHILAAQKLGLTDNLNVVSFRAEMSRGETAQLIWDMLGTEIAITDPLTGELIYPGKEDESAYGILLGPGKIVRETYLERAGFASGKLVVTVKAYNEAKKGEDYDTVTVTYDGGEYTLRASDLHLTKETPKITYLGLPMTLYVNCKAEDFFAKYDIDGEGETRVVLVNTDALTDVENLGDAGNIRVYDDFVMLGGVKYAFDKYETAFYSFGDKGWQTDSGEAFKNAFAYSDKDGYEGTNSNGAVRYIVRETKEGGETVKTLHIYYMPYAFGRYFVRTLKDATTGKNAQFITLGSYEANRVENPDGETSNFVEYLLGTEQKVTSATVSVSGRNGEKAKTATVSGEVKHGEFIFYHYNSVDNILTVTENHGGFRYGKLTGTSAAKETVRIDGVNYGFGFAGAMDADFATYAANKANIQSIISAYEGENNVQYVLAGDNVVYLAAHDGTGEAQSLDFAILSLDPALLADLMDVNVDKLTYTADFVLDKSGNVVVARLNTANGKWELASIDRFGLGYDVTEEDYTTEGDLGEYAKYVELTGEGFTRYADYVRMRDALAKGGIFAVTEDKDGVLNVGEASGAVEFATVAEGLEFSDVTNKTNKIKADPDASVEASRITLTDGTVIVIVDGEGNVGVRHGVQKAKYTVSGAADFYAASSSLIVAVIREPVFAGDFTDVSDWGESLAATTEETYYIALDSSESVIEANGADAEKKYTVTVTDLFDLRTLTVVEEISFMSDEAVSLDLAKPLYANEQGVLSVARLSVAEAFKAAVLLNGAEEDVDYRDIAPEHMQFIDADTVKVTGGALALPNVLAGVNAHVVTIDTTGIDGEDYDFDRLAVNAVYDAENGLGGNELEISEDLIGYEYPLYGDMVELVHEPTVGVLDQFILNASGAELLVPETDSDTYEGALTVTVSLKILGAYDADTGILTLYEAKILSK